MAEGTTGIELSICKQCSSAIAWGADYIDCEGFCNNACHVKCANISADELASYRKNKNFWWMCDQCLISMREMRDRVNAQRMETAPTRSDVDCNKGMKSLSSECPTPENWKLEIVANELSEVRKQISTLFDDIAGLKSIRETFLDSSLNVSSSPLSSTKLMQGSKRVTNTVSRNRSDASEKFWLFFTRIKNTVTEDQMVRMVHDSLGGISNNDVDIKKLVPYWKDVSTMQYISFKVGVHPSLKHTALSPSTWPVGLCYREFHNDLHTWNPQC